MDQSKALPDYRNPPINEVVCGVRFRPLDRFTLPHVGLFWSRVRHDFPNVQHATPLVSEGGLAVDEASGGPLPRVWLINESDDRLIQLQVDHLFFNWRRRGGEYPRFPTVIDGFARSLTTFLDFVTQANLGEFTPIACELSYVNHVPKGQGWQEARDIASILRDFSWQSDSTRFLPDPEAYGWQARFPLPGSLGRLVAKLNQATRKEDQMPLLVLELSAKGIGDDKTPAGLLAWFDVAHEWIVRGFADLTAVGAQKDLWGRVDA